MSVVAGTPSIDVPNASEIRTRSPSVTLTMTARRLSVAIALRTTSAIADVAGSCGVVAAVPTASGAAAGHPNATTATMATGTRTACALRTPRLLLRIITNPPVGFGATQRGSRPRSWGGTKTVPIDTAVVG